MQRGYLLKDEKEFRGEAVHTLCKAGQDLFYLLNHGYKVKGASVFVGNHYLLSERQRLAISRGVTSSQVIDNRRKKQLQRIPEKSTIYIDGFNTIITLEVVLSNSFYFKSMDGTMKDLAGLRGTYRTIDKTEKAIALIGEMLEESKVGKAVFYLDAPVSNSGSLKVLILKLLQEYDFLVEVEIINNVDTVLSTLENVVTSDGIILDKCKSWINLNRSIIETRIDNKWYVDFSKLMVK